MRAEDLQKCAGCGKTFDDCDDVQMLDDKPYHGDDCYELAWEARCEMLEEQRDPDSPYYLIDGVGFADPGGNSALRAETKNNPRNLPCPTCGEPNRLTPLDQARGYQCDSCADAAERGY